MSVAVNALASKFKFAGLGTLEQIVVSGGNFLNIAIAAWVLTPLEHSDFLTTYFIYLFFLLSSTALIYQSAAVSEQSNREGFYAGLAVLQVGIVLFGCAVFYLGYLFISDFYPLFESVDVFVYCLLFSISQVFHDFMRRFFHLRLEISKALLLVGLVFLSRISVLVFYGVESFYEFIVCVSLPALLISFFCFIIYSGSFSHFQRSYYHMRKQLKLSGPLLLSALFAWGWSTIPIYILAFFTSKEIVGILGSLRVLVNVFNIFLEQLEVLYVRRCHVRFQENSLTLKDIKTESVQFCLFASISWLMALVFLHYFGEFFSSTFFGERISEYHEYLFWIMFVNIFYMFSRIYSAFIRTQCSNFVFESVANFLSLIVAVVLGVVLCSWLDVVGFLVTMAVVYLTMLLCYHYYYLNRVKGRFF